MDNRYINSVYKLTFLANKNDHANVVYMAKHMNMVGPLLVGGSWAHLPPKSCAA